MKPKSFNQFYDDLIVEASLMQLERPSRGVDVFKLCASKSWDVSYAWQRNAVTLMVERGIAKDWSSSGKPAFQLTGAGFSAADGIIAARIPPTLKQRFASISRSDWIALGAFITSIIALFK